MTANIPEAMKFDYFVRWFNKDAGEWQSVNIQDLTDAEFRQFLMWKLGFVGMKKQ